MMIVKRCKKCRELYDETLLDEDVAIYKLCMNCFIKEITTKPWMSHRVRECAQCHQMFLADDWGSDLCPDCNFENMGGLEI